MSQLNLIRKEDILDSDFFDAYELSSDGYEVYFSGATVLSTSSISKTVVVSGITQTNRDNNVEVGDRVYLYGTSGADGYYTIASILNDYSFTTLENIVSSTGGKCDYIYHSGALNIGFDPTRTNNITAHNVQDAIDQLDQVVTNCCAGKGNLDGYKHAELRQLIHLADGIGGPFEGFITGAYRELTGSMIFPTTVTWYVDSGKTKKIVEKFITYDAFLAVSQITWNVYFNDGINVAATATDIITNSGPFEISRIRNITDYSVTSGALTEETHKSLRQLIHLSDGVGGPFETFPNGVYREINPVGPFPTSIIWYMDATKTSKIVEKFITYNGYKMPTQVLRNVYDTNGVTILATVIDTMTYSGAFEINRTRAIM
jgi:hypothetical protein